MIPKYDDVKCILNLENTSTNNILYISNFKNGNSFQFETRNTRRNNEYLYNDAYLKGFSQGYLQGKIDINNKTTLSGKEMFIMTDDNVAILQRLDKLSENLEIKISNLDVKIDGKLDRLESKIDGKLDKIESKINDFRKETKEDFNKVDKKIDILTSKIEGIDKRTTIIETATSTENRLNEINSMKKFTIITSFICIFLASLAVFLIDKFAK